MNTLTLKQLTWGPKQRAPLSLTITAGETWVILGPNGSGKTTLLHTLAGLQPPTQGSIEWNHRPLPTYSAKARAQALGIVFQTHETPFPINIHDYCKAARYPYGKESAALTQTHVMQALNALALTSHQYQRLNTLSGGERQRAALAALLVQNPRFYLLDEPTNHLDLAHQLNLLKQLTMKAAEGHGVITSLHQITQAERLATHALFLFKDGSHLHGKATDLFTEPQLSRLYECKLQRHQTPEAVFWQAEMCYNEVTSFGRHP